MAFPPLTVALPPNLDLRGGCEIRVTALDPNTGNVMSGVGVYDVTMEVEALDTSDLAYGPFMLVAGPQGGA